MHSKSSKLTAAVRDAGFATSRSAFGDGALSARTRSQGVGWTLGRCDYPRRSTFGSLVVRDILVPLHTYLRNIGARGDGFVAD